MTQEYTIRIPADQLGYIIQHLRDTGVYNAVQAIMQTIEPQIVEQNGKLEEANGAPESVTDNRMAEAVE